MHKLIANFGKRIGAVRPCLASLSSKKPRRLRRDGDRQVEMPERAADTLRRLAGGREPSLVETGMSQPLQRRLRKKKAAIDPCPFAGAIAAQIPIKGAGCGVAKIAIVQERRKAGIDLPQ